MNSGQGLDRGSLLALAGLAAAAVAYVMLFFLPGTKAMAAMLAELEEKRADILDAHKSRAIAEQAQREIESTHAYNARHQAQLLKSEELPALYGQISQITKSHELTTVRFEPQPAVGYDSFNKISIGLGLTGSFSAIHEMLRDLESLPARIWIDDLRIRGPRESGKLVECDVNLVVFIDNPENID